MARKPFIELTDTELVELTDEQINDYIDLACAEAGIGFMPPVPVEPDKGAVPDDATVFQIAWIYFRTSEAAAVVQRAIVSVADDLVELEYISGPSYRKRVKHGVDVPNVTTATALSAELARTGIDRVHEIETAKKLYSKQKDAYDKVVSARRSHVEDVRGAVADARDREYQRAERRRQFQRFLELADHQRPIAVRFMAQTYPDALELLPELAGEWPTGTDPNPRSDAAADVSTIVDDEMISL